MADGAISVLVAAYNVESTIQRCLESIQSQTYDNFEVIVVDDGSTDETPMICDSFSLADQRFKVIHKENGGLSSARNAGLLAASNSLVAFVDGDDLLMPMMLERLKKVLEETHADIAYCDWFVNDVEECSQRFEFDILEKESYMSMILTDRITSHVWNKLYKKKVWDGVVFPIGRVAQDMAVMHRVFDNAKRVVHLNERLYVYFADNPNNISNTNAKKISSSYDRVYALTDRYRLAQEKYPQVEDEVFSQLAGFEISAYYKTLIKSDDRRFELAEWILENKGKILKSSIPFAKKVLAAVVGTPIEAFVSSLIARKIEVK